MSEITNEILLERINTLNEVNQLQHLEIIKQTTKTNGSIARHEECIVDLQKKDIMLGNSIKSGRVLWIAVTTLISMILYLLGKYVY